MFKLISLATKLLLLIFTPLTMSFASTPAVTHLEFAGSYQLPWGNGISIADGYAYIAAERFGILVFDLRKQEISRTIAVPCWPRDVKVLNQRAYIACSSLIAGQAYGFAEVDLESGKILQLHPTATYAAQIEVKGQTAYLAVGEYGGLTEFNIQTGQSKTYLTGSKVSGVHIVDDIAYLANGSRGLLAIDLLKGTTREWTKIFQAAGSLAFRVQVSDNRAFVINRWGGLSIIDLSSGKIKMLNLHEKSTLDVLIDGEVLYVASGGKGISLVDVKQEQVIGSYNDPAGVGVNHLAVDENFVYATAIDNDLTAWLVRYKKVQK